MTPRREHPLVRVNDDGGAEYEPTWRSRAGDFALILMLGLALIGGVVWFHGCMSDQARPRPAERR